MSMKRVLVIDDDESYRQMVSSILKQSGFAVLDANNGNQGIELAQTHALDLVICDVMMENLDGFGVLDRLRMDPATSTMPFIFMTGLTDKESMRKGMTLGADDFLVKPFTGSDLRSAVEARLEKHREMTHEAERKLTQLRTSISLALPHELRTPLTAILGYSEVLAADRSALDQAEITYAGRAILRAGLGLRRVIENFLIYAQIEVIATDSKKVESLRKSQLSHCSELIEPLSRRKAESHKRLADLTLELSDGPVAMSTEYLTKIVEELLDNAFKFSEAGTSVHLTTSTNKDDFVLSIQDQGRGMSARQLADLGAYVQFERRFYEQKGTGLGLTIAKRLTELHGGRMEFELNESGGTNVLVYLPQYPLDSPVLTSRDLPLMAQIQQ
jgi:signal transduction histidine kinase